MPHVHGERILMSASAASALWPDDHMSRSGRKTSPIDVPVDRGAERDQTFASRCVLNRCQPLRKVRENHAQFRHDSHTERYTASEPQRTSASGLWRHSESASQYVPSASRMARSHKS
jgi:hypothetical protein